MNITSICDSIVAYLSDQDFSENVVDNKVIMLTTTTFFLLIGACALKVLTSNKSQNNLKTVENLGGRARSNVNQSNITRRESPRITSNSVNKKLNVDLFDAIKGGNTLEYIKSLFLIHSGANLRVKDKLGNTYLHYVSGERASEIIELLLEKGCDVNDKNYAGETPLMILPNSSIKCVKLLLEAGAQADDGIGLAIDRENQELLKFLIEQHGANINKKNSLGRTKLHFLASHQGKAIQRKIDLVLNNGGDINSQDNLGITPLLYALYEGEMETAKFLMSRGADPNIPDDDGVTPDSLLSDEIFLLGKRKGQLTEDAMKQLVTSTFSIHINNAMKR